MSGKKYLSPHQEVMTVQSWRNGKKFLMGYNPEVASVRARWGGLLITASLIVSVLIQTSLGPVVGPFFPQLPVAFLLFLLLTVPFAKLAGPALLAGLIAEFFSGFPFGLFLIAFLGAFFLSALVHRYFLAQRSLLTLLALTGFGTAVFFAFHYCLVVVFSENIGGFYSRFLSAILPTIVSSVALAAVAGLAYRKVFEIKVE